MKLISIMHKKIQFNQYLKKEMKKIIIIIITKKNHINKIR